MSVLHETSREHYRRKDGLCPCGSEPRISGQAYGLKCRAAYNRLWRIKEKRRRKADHDELERLRALSREHQGEKHGQEKQE